MSRIGFTGQFPCTEHLIDIQTANFRGHRLYLQLPDMYSNPRHVPSAHFINYEHLEKHSV